MRREEDTSSRKRERDGPREKKKKLSQEKERRIRQTAKDRRCFRDEETQTQPHVYLCNEEATERKRRRKSAEGEPDGREECTLSGRLKRTERNRTSLANSRFQREGKHQSGRCHRTHIQGEESCRYRLRFIDEDLHHGLRVLIRVFLLAESTAKRAT